MDFDLKTIEYILKSMKPEEAEEIRKALNRAGLVQKEVTVTRNGKTFVRKQWVRVDKDQKKGEKHSEIYHTDKKHKNKNGEYKEQRAKLHEKIISDIMNECGKPRPGEKPVAILMGGGSAAGKSTMRDKTLNVMLKERGIKAGIIDADKIKEALPEFEKFKKIDVNKAAAATHDESSDITKKAIDHAIATKRHFIYDGTMKSKDKYLKLVDQLKKAGYEIHVYVADVPLDVALERNKLRGELTGRLVPDYIVEASHRGVPGTFEALKDKVDSFQVYDTQTKNPKLIYSNNYIDEKRYQQFLDKGNVQFRAIN